MSFNNRNFMKENHFDLDNNGNKTESVHVWASNHPELQQACIRNQICLNNPPYRFRYKLLPTIKQNGPMCGLTALSMALNGHIHQDELLYIAQQMGFTNNGEMFSCRNMMMLIKRILYGNEGYSDVVVELQKGDLCSTKTTERLLRGSLMLVPYDADFNNYPCRKKGHKAHWAVLCGAIVITESAPYTETYVLTKHGKHIHLCIWSLQDLALSNANLLELSPKRVSDNLDYVYPEGGMAGENGLCNQFIFIDGL